jgi:hypothetical protein
VERVFLYQPGTTWTYSHHPSISFFDGRFYAIWSNGRRDEDAPGQRLLLSTSAEVTVGHSGGVGSADFRPWSEPKPLVDTLSGTHSELVLTAAGFHQHGATLVAYFGQYEYTPGCLENGVRRPGLGAGAHDDTCLRALTTDGRTWRGILDLGLPIVPNHPPQRTASGRLIISGNISFPYTDDPSGLTGWTMTGIYPAEMERGLQDDSEGFWLVRERRGWPGGLCEGSFYQTDDGVVHMLLRSHTERLWVTESFDDGETWSSPAETGFTDNGTKFHFGRLPDGRFYYVGCPDPQPRGERNPLVLSLSEDGVRFDRHYILADEPYARRWEGLHKHGQYGYPHTMCHEGHLYVVVSRQKEAVELLRASVGTL